MTFTVFYCTFFTYFVCLSVSMSVCVCVWTMLPDSNKMMMMTMISVVAASRLTRLPVERPSLSNVSINTFY